MHEIIRIVLAVTNGGITNRILVSEDFTQQTFAEKIESMLYEYRFAEVIVPDWVTMDIIREKVGTLIDDKTAYTFGAVALIECSKRVFDIYETKEPASCALFMENSLKLDIFALDDSLLLSRRTEHFKIEPEEFNDIYNGWIPMTAIRPEQFDHLIKDFHDDYDSYNPLLKMTKPVLVYWDGSYRLDYRRKFKNHRTWIWHNMEGVPDDGVYWREVPEFPDNSLKDS